MRRWFANAKKHQFARLQCKVRRTSLPVYLISPEVRLKENTAIVSESWLATIKYWPLWSNWKWRGVSPRVWKKPTWERVPRDEAVVDFPPFLRLVPWWTRKMAMDSCPRFETMTNLPDWCTPSECWIIVTRRKVRWKLQRWGWIAFIKGELDRSSTYRYDHRYSSWLGMPMEPSWSIGVIWASNDLWICPSKVLALPCVTCFSFWGVKLLSGTLFSSFCEQLLNRTRWSTISWYMYGNIWYNIWYNIIIYYILYHILYHYISYIISLYIII